MRNAAFQRRMTLLAIAAMVLLALLPTAGRLWSAGANASRGAWAQMCTMAGLKLVNIASAGSSTPAVPGHDGHAGGSDCPYCPLANAIASLLLWVAVVLPLPVSRSWPRRHALQWVVRGHPCGLGSRGPPDRFRITA